MQAYCDKCKQPTNKTKSITSKKSGKTYLVYECINGCVSDQNPRFPHSFFPPRESGSQQAPRPQAAASQVGNEMLEQLKIIAEHVRNIDRRLALANDPLEKVDLSEDEPF